MTSYVLFLSSFLGSSYSSRPCPYRVFALSTTSLDSRLVATFCDSPLSTYPTHLSLRAAKGTRTRLAPSPPQSPASSPRPSAVPTLSGLTGDLGASSDAGVYVYSSTGDHACIIVLYVDDLLLLGDSKPFIEEVKRKLKQEYQMTDLGPVERFLGLRIRRDRAKRKILVDQTEYIQTVLERFQMNNSKSQRTPLPAGAVLESNKDTASDQFRTQYQSIIGSIMYAMLGTRPDIAFAVTRLAKFASNPSQAHMGYAYYILRYLQGTKDYALCYDGASNSGLVAYSDSDWAEDRDDRHSTSGFVFMMANCVVSWASRRQPTVSLSSTEAEYKAASDTCRQMAWLRNFGKELGDNMTAPTPLCLDNQGSIFLAVNPAVDRRTKHIEIRYHFIREFYESGETDIFYVASEDQLADQLTKNLPFSSIEKFRSLSGMVSTS